MIIRNWLRDQRDETRACPDSDDRYRVWMSLKSKGERDAFLKSYPEVRRKRERERERVRESEREREKERERERERREREREREREKRYTCIERDSC